MSRFAPSFNIKSIEFLYRLEERIIHTYGTPLRDSRGKRIGILIVMNDVTQLRRLENMRRNFTANVSHEIKTPLTVINGFAETLCHSSRKNPEETDRFLGIIEKYVNRPAAIIENLIILSRIEQQSEKNEIHIEKNIKNIIQTAVNNCKVHYKLFVKETPVTGYTVFHFTPQGEDYFTE